MFYFRDSNEIGRRCISSVIEIARVLYKVTKELEDTGLPGKIANIYERLESIDGCPYFSRDVNEYTANDIKVRCSAI